MRGPWVLATRARLDRSPRAAVAFRIALVAPMPPPFSLPAPTLHNPAPHCVRTCVSRRTKEPARLSKKQPRHAFARRRSRDCPTVHAIHTICHQCALSHTLSRAPARSHCSTRRFHRNANLWQLLSAATSPSRCTDCGLSRARAARSGRRLRQFIQIAFRGVSNSVSLNGNKRLSRFLTVSLRSMI